MKNILIKYIVAAMLLLIVGGVYNYEISLAASAEVVLSSDESELTVGEKVFVYINISSDTLFNDFEANLVYDDEILEYQKGASVITGDSGFLKISDMGVLEGSKTRKYTLQFKVLKVGISEVAFSGRPRVYTYNTEEMSVSSNDITIEGRPAITASDNAYLKSLKISPAVLEPGFDKSVLEYNASIEYSVERLIVNALPEDSKASVRIIGNDNLKEGENKIIITVLAESGAVIEYTVNVFREVASADEEPVADDTAVVVVPSEKHGTFEVVRIDGDLFAVYGGRYQLIEPDSEVKIPSGYIKTKIIISGISVNAYTLESNLEDDFLLIYAKNELGDIGFYRYDRIERTLQRYVPANIGYNNPINSNIEDVIQSEEYRSNISKAAIFIALISGICILLIIIIIRMYMKLKGIKEDDLDD